MDLLDKLRAIEARRALFASDRARPGETVIERVLGPCEVTMDAAKSVTATFAVSTYALAVRVTGRGVVRSSPAGIVCSKSCSRAFAAGSIVRLTAKASKRYRFSGWSGACRGTKGCAVTLGSAKSVRATFRKRS